MIYTQFGGDPVKIISHSEYDDGQQEVIIQKQDGSTRCINIKGLTADDGLNEILRAIRRLETVPRTWR